MQSAVLWLGLGIVSVVLVGCSDSDPLTTPVLPIDGPFLATLQPDTGTTLDGLGCGTVSAPCYIQGVTGTYDWVINKSGSPTISDWSPCGSQAGGCLNIGGPPQYGEVRWGAAAPTDAQSQYLNAYRPDRYSQEQDIKLAMKKIMCPKLRNLAEDMLATGNLWINQDPTAAGGEFIERYGKTSPEPKGTIYLNEGNWVGEGGWWYLDVSLSQLAVTIAHEAAHAWFGLPNTLNDDQHIAIHDVAYACT